MWELDHKEGWRIDALNCSAGEDSWESFGQQGDQTSQSWREPTLFFFFFLEGLMLKLKLQYFGHLMWRPNSLKKTLMLGKIEGRRRKEYLKMRLLDSTTDSMDMNLSKLQETVKDREVWHGAVHGVTESQTWQQLNSINSRTAKWHWWPVKVK